LKFKWSGSHQKRCCALILASITPSFRIFTGQHMSNAPLFLESYIFPICRYEELDGLAHIREFYGTGFFVGVQGVFITATHVIDAADEGVKLRGGFVGLCIRYADKPENLAVRIASIDAAPPPYDISVGKITANIPSWLTLGQKPITVFQDVAAYGFPATAQNHSNHEFWMHGRGFRGYVHRPVASGDLEGSPHPDAFELSFSMPQGLSGAPLFTYDPNGDVAIGVCVGINRGESTEFVIEEVQDDGKVFIEKRVRVEEYGIAHDLRPLLSWRPANLEGHSLEDVAKR
jgi:S1-C subfamily serine protease